MMALGSSSNTRKSRFSRVEVYVCEKNNKVNRYFLPLNSSVSQLENPLTYISEMFFQRIRKRDADADKREIFAVLECFSDGSMFPVKFPESSCLIRVKTPRGNEFYKVSSFLEADKLVSSLENSCFLSYQVLGFDGEGNLLWEDRKVGGLSSKKLDNGITRYYYNNKVIGECYDRDAEALMIRVMRDLKII